MSLAVQRRFRTDAPIDSSLSESRGKSLNIHQVIHAVNQNKRNFMGNVSPFERRAILSSGRINDVFRTDGK